MIQTSENVRVRNAVAWLMLGITSGLMLDLFAKQLLRTYSLSTLSLSFYAIVGPMIVSIFVLDEQSWLGPDPVGWALLIGAGVSSVVAWIGLLNGYRAASPALLAPLEYTALAGGAIAGYLFWDEVPDVGVAIGVLIIIGSGLFVVYRNNEVNPAG